MPAGVWQAARVAEVGRAADAGRAAELGPVAEIGGVIEGGGELEDAAAGRGTASDAAGDEGAWSLVSCVVTPGFAYEDFELARREDLARRHPGLSELIAALT